MNPDENPSPLPQPTHFTCRNCGFGWNEGTPFCPRCGAPRLPATRSGNSEWITLASGCGFVLFGVVGGCFTLVGAGDGFNASALNGTTFFGVILLVLAMFLLWVVIRGGK